jgi:hypothetical protein
VSRRASDPSWNFSDTLKGRKESFSPGDIGENPTKAKEITG